MIYFQLNNPNVSVSLVANQLSNLTDVKSGKPLYAGDLKLLVDVIGVLSRRGLGTSQNESSDASESFVKVSVDDVTKIIILSFFKRLFCRGPNQITEIIHMLYMYLPDLPINY